MQITNAKIAGKSYWGTTRTHSSTYGDHMYHNCSQVLEFEIDGDRHAIEYQNGHGYYANDLTMPSNLYDVYIDNTDGEHAPLIRNFANWDIDELDDEAVDDYNEENGASYTLEDVMALLRMIEEHYPESATSVFSDDLDDYDMAFGLNEDNDTIETARRLVIKTIPEGWDFERS